jgi:hypothetical protein
MSMNKTYKDGSHWLVGIPIVVARLWGAAETATRLLPNLL